MRIELPDNSAIKVFYHLQYFRSKVSKKKERWMDGAKVPHLHLGVDQTLEATESLLDPPHQVC
jgi:hypothetical protein